MALYGFKACGCRFSPWAAFFAVIVWSAAIDLVLALALVDVTAYGRFYMATGEEYFKSSWGFFALLWDGTAHYALQLLLAHHTLLERPCRVAGLFWAGSILNSMPVLLIGAATGIYSHAVKPSTALNAPYVGVPIAYLVALFASRSASGDEPTDAAPAPVAATQAPAPATAPAPASPLMTLRPRERTGWLLWHGLALLLHAWRVVVALGSRSPAAAWWVVHLDPLLGAPSRPSYAFVRVQCLSFFFYYVPYHAWAAHQLVVGGSKWGGRRLATLADVSIIFAGAYAQAQVTYVGSVVYEWTEFAPLVRNAVPVASWVLGAALALLPSTFALRCWQLKGL